MPNLLAKISISVTNGTVLPCHIKTEFRHNTSGVIYATTTLIEEQGVSYEASVNVTAEGDSNIANYTISHYYMNGNVWSPTTEFLDRAALPADLKGGLSFNGHMVGYA